MLTFLVLIFIALFDRISKRELKGSRHALRPFTCLKFGNLKKRIERIL